MPRAGLAAFVLGVALGLAAGVGLGVVLATGGASGDIGSGRPGAADDATENDAPDSPASAGTATKSARRTKRAAADPLLGLLPADVSAPPADATGVIRGTVRDADGRGIPGVAIEIDPNTDDRPDSPDRPDPKTPEDRLRREIEAVVEAFRWSEGRRRTTTTGPDGTYEATGIGDGRFIVAADADGWDLDRIGERWVRAGAICNFRATRRVAVAFDVRLPDGKAPDDADVTAETTNRGGGWSTSWSADDPTLNLPAGDYFVRARSGEFDEWASERVLVTVPEDGRLPVTRLDLAPRLGFGGHVLASPDTANAPDSVWIAHMSVDGATVPDDEDVLRSGDDTWTEPGETWNWVNVEPGRYAIVAAVRGRRVIWREVVEVRDRFLVRDIQIPARDLGDAIVARALAPDGTVVEDVEWATGVEDHEERVECEVAARPLGDGRFRLPLCEPDAPNAGYERSSGVDEDGPHGVRRRWVKAMSPKYGEVRVDHAPGDRGEVTVQFAAPATIEIVVDGPKGRAMRGLRLGLDREGADRGEEWESRRDENPGTIRMGPFPSGPATLTIRMYCQNGDEFEVATRPLALAAGTNRVSVALPPTQDVAIRADAEGADLEMSSVDPADGASRDERIDGDENSDGVTFTWDTVPHGRYIVRDSDLGEMSLTVPCPDVVRFAPRPYSAFRVNLDPDDDDDATFLEAGLRNGDVCVAINGAEVAGSARIHALFTAAGLQPRVNLTIVRGTQRVEIDMDTARLDELDWDAVAR